MRTLTKEEFNSLSEAEQVVIRALGLDVGSRKKPRKSHVKCTSGEPYVLVTNITCRLCGSLHTKIFMMSKQDSFLRSEELPEIPTSKELGKMKVKNSHYKVKHCHSCYSYLACFSKEDLIQKFLSYAYDSRNFMI
jgi:hypothetical protein